MYLFFTDVQKVRRVGGVPGLSAADLCELFARSVPAAGMPVLLSGSMRPVEPLCSWFRELSLNRRSAKTMRAYAYTALMLLRFLHARGLDLGSASELDVLEFRRWRLDDSDKTVGEATWDRDAAAIGCLYAFLVRQGIVERGRGAAWRGSGGRWPAEPAATCGCGTWSSTSTCTCGTSGSGVWTRTGVWTGGSGAGFRIATARPASWLC